ncbi:Endonuclease/exonuclease/phosphatase [Amanita rubescens]|nr:Endonuclease/exonuclease/phosphatase [Amanita rubescens]
MPPKRKAKSPAANEEEHATKKSRVEQETGTAQPTNKVLPIDIKFPPRVNGRLRLSTWNIAGWSASQKKGFKYYVEAEDPDILVLTELKLNDPPADPAVQKRFPHCYWSFASKKSYAGTAVLSKIKPLNVTYELPGHPDPASVKGRLITLEFPNMYLVNTYVVNAGTGLKTLDAKNEWNLHFTKYIRDLEKQKPVIWAGDLNVAPTELDLSNAKKNWNKTAGYTEAETSAFKNILNPPDENEPKFVDVWRRLHPQDRHYSYFSYRFNCRVKGIGWRLDMFVASEQLLDRVKMCEIRSEIYGASDHCPVVMEMEGDL